MTWLFTTIPPGTGRRNGFVTTFSGRTLQLVAEYQLNHDSGPVIWGEITEWSVDNVVWQWRSLMPSAIGFDLSPGFVMQVQFLELCIP